MPLLLEAVQPARALGRARTRRARRWSGPIGLRWTRRSAATARRSARSTSPCTTWPARRCACRSTGCWGSRRDIPPTDFTLGLDEPAWSPSGARRASRFPALKIKVGGPPDLATLEAVRAVFGGPIRVDANTGWTPDQGAPCSRSSSAWASS